MTSQKNSIFRQKLLSEILTILPTFINISILVKEVTEGDMTTIELENVPDEPSVRYFQQPATTATGIRQQIAENAEEQLVLLN